MILALPMKNVQFADFARQKIIILSCIQCIKSNDKRKRVRCETCFSHPDIVKRFCYRGRLPPICIEEGVETRNYVIKNHWKSQAHSESLKSDNINKLSKVMKEQAVPILKAVSVQNADRTKQQNKRFDHFSVQ